MLILMDDGHHKAPTHQNILNSFTLLTQYSRPGDVVFVHYSGHGGRVKDTSGKYKGAFQHLLKTLSGFLIYAIFVSVADC